VNALIPAYFDAIYNKKNKVVLVLVEALGGIIDETMDELGRLCRIRGFLHLHSLIRCG